MKRILALAIVLVMSHCADQGSVKPTTGPTIAAVETAAVMSTAPTMCKSHQDCKENEDCENGFCVRQKTCKNHDDCKENEDCVKGFCIKANGGRNGQQGDVATLCQEKDSTSGNLKGNRTLYFGFNDFTIIPENIAQMDVIVACLREHPEVKITLEGFTDERGTSEYNLDLSAKRTNIVFERLTRLGINQNAMKQVPRGSTQANDCSNAADKEECWRLDRKVVFLLSK